MEIAIDTSLTDGSIDIKNRRERAEVATSALFVYKGVGKQWPRLLPCALVRVVANE